MSTMNTFQILAKKKLVGLANNKVMQDDNFARDLAKLLLQYDCPKSDLVEILREIKQNDKHNDIEEKNKEYVYSRFDQFDENLNWLSRVTNLPEKTLKLFSNA